VRRIADSNLRFGFVNPVLVDAEGQGIAGHGRLEGAKVLGMTEVPVLPFTHLRAAENRAYILANNCLAEKAGWDRVILSIQPRALIAFDFEVLLTGFELAEIDLILDEDRARKSSKPEVADLVPEISPRFTDHAPWGCP
jgi:ParB-like chromosome segregation protein Spo0J